MGCLHLLLLLIYADDIELRASRKKRGSFYNFSSCHWNLNSAAAHSFSKLTLLEDYNIKHNFDIICFSETNLDSSIQHDDERLHLNGYKLSRTVNPNNIKEVELYLF